MLHMSTDAKITRAIYAACAIFLLTLVVLSYRQAPENSFHLDDRSNIVDSPAVHMSQLSLDGLIFAARHSELVRRPIPNLTFAVDWWRGQGSPAPFIQTNVALHMLVTLAGLAFLTTIFRECGYSVRRSVIAATAAMALWATHPIQVQAVSYAVQRMTSMAALFIVLAMLSYLKARTGNRRQLLWWTVCMVSIAAGALSKENAWMAPVFLLLLEFGVVRHRHELLQHRQFDIFLLLLPGAIGALILADMLTGLGPVADYLRGADYRDFTAWERLLTQPRVIWFHLSQVAWPSPERFSIAHDFVKSTSLINPFSTLLAILASVAWISTAIWLIGKKDRRVVGFFLLFFPVSLIPESSIIPLEMIFEHRMYLPGIALAGLAGYAMLPILLKGSIWQISVSSITLIAVIAYFVMATQTVVMRWKDDYSLWSHAVRHAPKDPRAHDHLSHALRNLDRMDEALAHAEIAVQLDPMYVNGLHNLGRLLQVTGERGRAYEMFDRAVQLAPTYAPVRFSLGVFYLEMGELARAKSELAHALRYDPYHGQARLFYNYTLKAIQEKSSISH
jgi:Tfp pilus assembly protein PilF